MSLAIDHRLPRRGRAFTPRTRAFTLVEMLIVIAIISVLAALLLPAVNMAREMARKASCSNNLKNLALAAIQFDSAKGKLPASRTYWEDPKYIATGYHPQVCGNTSPPAEKMLTWVHEIMPYIERQDMRAVVETALMNNQPLYGIQGKLNIVLCPSDETDDNVSSVTGSGTYSQLSYGCNSGAPDDIGITTATVGLDWPQNGVFDNRLKGKRSDGAPLASAPERNLKIYTTTLGDVTNGDGASNTVMFGENSNLEEWNFAPSEFNVGIVWDNRQNQWGTQNGAPAYSGYVVLNKYPNNLVPPDTKPGLLANIYGLPNSPNLDLNPSVLSFARPLSEHPTGFMMAFCDGRTKFVSEAIDYKTYCRLMTSKGRDYLTPGVAKGVNGNPPVAIKASQLTPITDDQF
jgi:prepilin-type N-terminal cleavage/methylation domain-containing protein